MAQRRTARKSSSSPEQVTVRAFNDLVRTHPKWAAVVLVLAILGVTLLFWLSGDDGDQTPAANTTHVTSTVAGTSPPSTSSAGAPASDPVSGLPTIAESELPPKAQQVLDAIRAGGPFEFDKDGSTFGNYEGLLPDEDYGYYAEYTVQMPGDSDRGAHRFVTGDGGEIYWTTDHYESFEAVVEGQ